MFVQLRGSLVIPLPEPTADSRVLAAYAIRGLKHMYRPGFEYKKAAVMLSELQPEGQRQACLWDDEADEVGWERSHKLMGCSMRSTPVLAAGQFSWGRWAQSLSGP